MMLLTIRISNRKATPGPENKQKVKVVRVTMKEELGDGISGRTRNSSEWNSCNTRTNDTTKYPYPDRETRGKGPTMKESHPNQHRRCWQGGISRSEFSRI
jgi:hypothetical protein